MRLRAIHRNRRKTAQFKPMKDFSTFSNARSRHFSSAAGLTVFALLLCVSESRASDALLHHTIGRGALKIVESRPSSFPLSSAAPANLAFSPPKSGKTGLFGAPKIAGRDLSVAFFGTGDVPDQVTADTNWNHKFDPDDATTTLSAASPSNSATKISPPILITIPGAPNAQYSLILGLESVTHWTTNGVETSWRGTLRSVGWASGTLRWNGRNMAVGVQDDNSNGRFDDPFETSRQSAGDLMFFDWNGDGQFEGSREVLRAGRYVFAGDQLCAVTIAAGGARLNLQLVAGGTGRFNCDASVREIHLVSPNGLLVAPVTDGAVELPVGKYSLLLWIARQAAGDGRVWEMKAGNATPPQITIGGAPAQLKLRAALSPVLSLDRQDDGLRFSLAVGTAGGDTLLRLAPLTGPIPASQLRLFDAEGRPLARIRLAPEGQATFGALWHPPIDAPATLRARLEFDHGPFEEVERPDWEFAVPQPLAR